MIAWLTGLIAKTIGLSSTAVWGGGARWAAFALGCLGCAAVSGVLVHAHMAATHAAEIAVIKAAQAEVLADRAADVLTLERQAAAHAQSLEDAHVRMAEERAAAGAEIARLSADLRTALDRVRRPAAGGGGAGGLSAAAADAGGCADVRASRDALATALDRLIAGGAGIVADGARAVDVATLAMQSDKARGAE